MNKVEAVISDADGTLVGTVELIRRGQYEAAKMYFEGHGIPAEEIPTYETYTSYLNKAVGGSTRDTFEQTVRLLYAEAPHHVGGMNFDELDSLLGPIQDALAPEYVKPYEGLSDLLTLLGRSGIKLAIFTSGTEHHVVRNFGAALPGLGLVALYKNKEITDEGKLRILEDTVKDQYDIAAFTVVTVSDTKRRKPAPDSLLLAMRRLGVPPDQALVLGDHAVDMQAGLNAGAQPLVGITHGFDDEATLRGAGATHIVDSLSELRRLLVSTE